MVAEGASRIERLASQRAYKAKLEATARERGWQLGEKREFASSGCQAQAPNKFLGQIIYHSGMLGSCCQNSFMIGNRFNSALGPSGMTIYPIERSGSFTMATFDMISVAGGAVFLSVFDQLNGTTANPVTSVNINALTGLNVATLTIPYAGHTFLAGIWQFNTDVPAVATGTVGGQGYHGISINAIVGTGSRPLDRSTPRSRSWAMC